MKKIALWTLFVASALFVNAQALLAPANTNNQPSELRDASFLNEQNPSAAIFLDQADRDAKIEAFLIQNAKKFPKSSLSDIRQTLQGLSDGRLQAILYEDFNDPIIVEIFSIGLGGLGVDRFIIGDTGLGVLKLLTVGGLGVWTVVDWFIIQDRTRKNNLADFMELCNI